MEDLQAVLKEVLFERAARLSVQAQKEDSHWQESVERYHEMMDALGEKVGEKTVLEWEDAVNFAHLHSETFFYWQGLMDGAALVRLSE